MTLDERLTFRNALASASPVQETGRRRDRGRPPGYKERAVRARIWLKRRASALEPKTEIVERSRP
jgi:hypothetical protein